MAYKQDINKLYNQGNGTYKDSEGSIYNAQGYRISESERSIKARQQAEYAAQQERERDRQIWRDAWNKAGGFPHSGRALGGKGFSLGGLGWIAKLYIRLIIVFGILFLGLTVVAHVIDAIPKLLRIIKELAGIFLLSWPRTFRYIGNAFKGLNLFKHFGTYWPFIPELLLGIYIPRKAFPL